MSVRGGGESRRQADWLKEKPIEGRIAGPLAVVGAAIGQTAGKSPAA